MRYRATVIIDFPHMATRELAVLPILRDEACGARIADSAGGGFGPRGAPWRRSVAASRSFILASPKILRLDNVQINLTLPSLNRTLADAEDTPPRQLQINLHCARLIRIFAADPAERQENGNVPAPSRTGSLTKGKHVWMMALIPRIAAVSYLNTIPFIYGIRHAGNLRAELLLTPPALCASNFIDGNADIALLPSAVVPRLKDAELVTDFCIGAEGEVRTVVVVSNTPIEEERRNRIDPNSRTSVQLTGYLAARPRNNATQWHDMSH